MKSRLIHENGGERTFVLIFETGDEALAGLTAFAKEKQLTAARFTAIGAFRESRSAISTGRPSNTRRSR